MADWRTISDTEVDPDAPVTSELAYAFRDNVVAAFEGAVGAPRLADAALGPAGSATSAGSVWVSRRNAIIGAGDIGSYVFAAVSGSAAFNFGSTTAGSNLDPQNASGSIGQVGGLGGTWRCMGRVAGTSIPADRITLWLRIS